MLKHSLGTLFLMMDKGIAPTKEGKEWLDVIVWDAVKFDLDYGRKKTRDVVATTRNDPESRRVREWKLSYQFDVLKFTCLLSELKWKFKSCE